LLVVTTGGTNRDEAVRFVKLFGAGVRRERPKFQQSRPSALGNSDQPRAYASAGERRLNVELVDPFVLEHEKGDDAIAAVCHPALSLGYHDALEPGTHLVVTMQRRRYRRDRCRSRAEPHASYRIRFFSAGASHQHCEIVARRSGSRPPALQM